MIYSGINFRTQNGLLSRVLKDLVAGHVSGSELLVDSFFLPGPRYSFINQTAHDPQVRLQLVPSKKQPEKRSPAEHTPFTSQGTR